MHLLLNGSSVVSSVNNALQQEVWFEFHFCFCYVSWPGSIKGVAAVHNVEAIFILFISKGLQDNYLYSKMSHNCKYFLLEPLISINNNNIMWQNTICYFNTKKTWKKVICM